MKALVGTLALWLVGGVGFAQQSDDIAQTAMADETQVVDPWLPSWPMQSFDWQFSPIVDFRYRRVETEGTTTRSTTTELGLKTGLSGITLFKNPNPDGVSLQFAPTVGWVRGDITGIKTTGNVADTDADHAAYDRSWGNIDLVAYYKFYRHTLSLGTGLRKYHERSDGIPTRAQTIANDFGVLLKSYLSGHLTYTWRKSALDRLSTPMTTEHDFWLHARYSASVLNFYIDAGPGSLYVTEYQFAPEHEEAAKGVSHYMKLLSGANLFWKLGMSGSVLYIYESNEDDLGSYSEVPLPDEGLYTVNRATMPEDSLSAAFFVGLAPIFGNFGLGWSYNVNILNVNERDGRQKQTTRNHGWGLTYQVSL